jgi:hypothetical protein
LQRHSKGQQSRNPSPFPEATAEEAAFFNQATNHPLMAHLAQ